MFGSPMVKFAVPALARLWKSIAPFAVGWIMNWAASAVESSAKSTFPPVPNSPGGLLTIVVTLFSAVA